MNNWGYFLIYLQIWSNYTTNWSEKLGKLVFLERKLKNKIQKTKNHSIWTCIREIIKEKSKERKIDREEREIDKILSNQTNLWIQIKI